MTEVKAMIGNVQVVRQLIAGSLTSPYDVIDQYVANSAASYRRLGQPGTVEIELHRKSSRRGTRLNSIVIADYAEGMTQEKMADIPQSIGNSEHGKDPSSNSLYQAGHLSFMYIASQVLYRSKHHQTGQASSLLLVADSETGRSNEHLDGLESRLQGTDVTISDIAREYATHVFTPEKLKRTLGAKFRGVLGSGLNLKIIETLDGAIREQVEVERRPYSGEKIIDETYISDGILPVHAVIHYSSGARGEGEVVVMHNGEVYGRLGTNHMGDAAVWKKAGLSGEVSFDSGVPNHSKTGFILKGKEYDRWSLQVIQPLEQEVTRITLEQDAQHQREKNSELYANINQALGETIRSFGRGLLQMPRSRASSRVKSLESVVVLFDPVSLREQMDLYGYNALTLGEQVGLQVEEAYFNNPEGVGIPNDIAPQILAILPGVKLKPGKGTQSSASVAKASRGQGPVEVPGIDTGVSVTLGPKIAGKALSAVISRPTDQERIQRAPRLDYLEMSFQDPQPFAAYDPKMGIIRINTDNPHYAHEVIQGTEAQKAAYIAQAAGLEIIKHQLGQLPRDVLIDAFNGFTLELRRHLDSKPR